jgi:multidrug efflux pump subunit AcrA (membrane-fusion protein)
MIRLVVLMLGLALPVSAEPMYFTGTIEAAARAEVTTLVDGVVRAIYIRAGEAVEEGRLLFEIERPSDLESRLSAARAVHDRRVAELADRRLVLARQETLRARDASSELRYEQSRTAVAVAEADRARITAPIAGLVDRPRVPPDAVVAAEAGAPPGVISRLDPIHVA